MTATEPLTTSRKTEARQPISLPWGPARLPTRYLLAPLAGYTGLAFRLAARELGGVGLATTDLVSPRALLIGNRKALELVKTCAEDRPLAVQIYGSEAPLMAEAAQWVEAHGATSVDINMGCPVHKIVRNGGGSALMCNVDQTINLIAHIVSSVKIPVTVKMRLGWDEQSLTAPFFAREFEKVGVAAITIHGRTRAQAFRGKVNLDGIRAVVQAVERIPVIGNGDIRTLADADRMIRETGCTGIAIGRGALLNPWIFRQLLTRETTGESADSGRYGQRLDFMERHFRLQVWDRGERHGILQFRKVANWYSKVLKPGPHLHRQMMLLQSVEHFDRILAELRELRFPESVVHSENVSFQLGGNANELW
jgi:nifR3 family TIM-barrel protein